jgi:hypothetical protein
MAKYDIETFLNDSKAYVQAKLPAKIAELNAEKNDGVTLKDIDNGAYFFQTLDDEVANFDPFIAYSISGVTSTGEGPYTQKQYTIDYCIVFVDQGSDKNATQRMLRYWRALEELFETSWDKIGDGLKLKVESLEPIKFNLINNSNDYRAVGISIEVNLG